MFRHPGSWSYGEGRLIRTDTPVKFDPSVWNVHANHFVKIGPTGYDARYVALSRDLKGNGLRLIRKHID